MTDTIVNITTFIAGAYCVITWPTAIVLVAMTIRDLRKHRQRIEGVPQAIAFIVLAPLSIPWLIGSMIGELRGE